MYRIEVTYPLPVLPCVCVLPSLWLSVNVSFRIFLNFKSLEFFYKHAVFSCDDHMCIFLAGWLSVGVSCVMSQGRKVSHKHCSTRNTILILNKTITAPTTNLQYQIPQVPFSYNVHQPKCIYSLPIYTIHCHKYNHHKPIQQQTSLSITSL